MSATYTKFPGSRSLKLTRFADALAIFLFYLSLAFAVGNGIITPLFSVFFGNLVDCFSKPGLEIQNEINNKVLTLLYLSLGAFLVGAGEVTLSAFSIKRQLNNGRLDAMDVVLGRPLGWHQVNKSSEIVNEVMSRDLPALEKGLHGFIRGTRHVICCFAGLVVAFRKGPLLTTLILSIVLPALSISSYILKRASQRYEAEVGNLTRKTNSIVRETFSQIKTVASFNLEYVFGEKYRTLLPSLERESVVTSLLSGAETALMAGIFSFSYALAIYYGAQKVADREYSGGQVLSILFASIMAGFSASEAIPCFHAVWMANLSMDRVCSTILKSPSDTNDEGKRQDVDFNMDIHFSNITFSYPTSRDKTVLSNFCLDIRANSSTAIVGPSGSGKSTLINLLLKHYIPDHGSILIDGIDLSEVKTDFWRSNIAFIPQETAIFSGTILENIQLAKPEATFEEVLKASKLARCDEFIQKMAHSYSTQLGNSNNLSGGQRQRIGIARALLRDAGLILLDEATSALDNKSELEIQESLSTIFESGTKTAIVIAHKLSTVVRMDNIVVMKSGQVVEKGRHGELVAMNGVYSSLVEAINSAELSYECNDHTELGVRERRQNPVLRDSILRKKSVRLSIIPERIRKAIDRKQENPREENQSSVLDFLSLIKMVFEGRNHRTMKLWLAICILSSCVMGLQYPSFSLALAGSVEIYLRSSEDSIRSGGSRWGLIYAGIGLGCIVAGTLQAYSRAKIGFKLDKHLKEMIFYKVVNFPIDWHDKVENDQSAVQALLSTHSHQIHQGLTSKISAILQTFVTLVASIAIAFTASSMLTLVILAVFPLLLAAQITQTWIKSHSSETNMPQINRFAFEATKNIKDILSFSMQGSIATAFRHVIVKSTQLEQKMFVFSGIAFGCSQFLMYNTIGLAFWYGTRQVVSERITVEDLMRAFCALFFATFSIAQSSSQFSLVAKAAESKEKISKVLSYYNNEQQSKARLPRCKGEVNFDNVTFYYPSRPDRLVFKHFSLNIPSKTSCALVGESGHGKSSCFGLLEIFYSPIEGSVKIDGISVDKFDKKWIRSIVSLVTQEPVIFEASIFDNIKYGNPMADYASVIEAARAAMCHKFIEKLPNTYDTMLGEGYVQLSGGQRQMIAIARAILKKSTILLMDEPTAALDGHSEVQIQNSLKSVMQGKTTIVVAHRLNTIKDFDMIATIYRGRVLEKGTHQELIDMDGYYCYLIRTQAK